MIKHLLSDSILSSTYQIWGKLWNGFCHPVGLVASSQFCVFLVSLLFATAQFQMVSILFKSSTPNPAPSTPVHLIFSKGPRPLLSGEDGGCQTVASSSSCCHCQDASNSRLIANPFRKHNGRFSAQFLKLENLGIIFDFCSHAS